MITGIILTAGNSVRFGMNKNKNLALINNKTILSFSLNAFLKNKSIDSIILVIRKEDYKEINNILKNENLSKTINIIYGGRNRKESVYKALLASSSKYVIIQDGARPFIKDSYIEKCIKALKKYKGVTMGVPVIDTIKVIDKNNIIKYTPERNFTWQAQTPQAFDKNILLKLHQKYKNLNITDDCVLLEKEGYKVKIIKSDYTNIKITTYSDLILAKELINNFKIK